MSLQRIRGQLLPRPVLGRKQQGEPSRGAQQAGDIAQRGRHEASKQEVQDWAVRDRRISGRLRDGVVWSAQ